jgi:hypothetical protein
MNSHETADNPKCSEFRELSSSNENFKNSDPLSLVTLSPQLSNLVEAMTEWNEKQYEVSSFAGRFHMTATE